MSRERLRLAAIVDVVRSRTIIEAEMRGVNPTLGTIRNLNGLEDYVQALRDAGLMGNPSQVPIDQNEFT